MSLNIPAYDPTEWTPAPIDRGTYESRRTHLAAQITATAAVISAYDTAFASAVAHPTLPLADSVCAAWNAAHDAERALTAELDFLESEWAYRGVDPYQRFLVANNID